MKSNQASSKSRNSYPFTWCFSSWLLVFTTCLWPMKAKPSTPVSSFFYNLLIFTDVFILLYSLRYTTKYFNLFRYSSFALATIFLRLTLSAPAYYNVLLAVIAGLMVLLVTYIYNYLLTKTESSKELKTVSTTE